MTKIGTKAVCDGSRAGDGEEQTIPPAAPGGHDPTTQATSGETGTCTTPPGRLHAHQSQAG